MHRLSTLAGLFVLAGCDRVPEPAPAPAPAAAAAPSPTLEPRGDGVASAERLAGEYRVAGVGGREVDLPYAITASISADRIHLTADCVNQAWTYRFEGGLLATERVAVEGCGRGLTAEEEALVAAFDGAERVTQLPSGAYEFTGEGPIATLFTQ